ncbi:MAG: Gfo/Idh/MocA family oxidoreductase [Victivallales bacterium]|nr:Gfo/Idh/MocA family oxidoreductase [Victivallales bacterium]
MGSKKKVVLVGCGGISNAWFIPSKEFDDMEYVGLVDINVKNAENRRKEHSLGDDVVVSADLGDVLDKTRPDAVFDCTVPPAHCEIVTTALSKGCHVLGEKPMAETMEQAAIMVKAAKDNNRIYAVIQNRRYDKNIIRFRDVVRDDIGNLTTLNADFYIGAHFGGFRDEMDHVLLIDMAIHTFDQARFISGKDPVAVMAYEWNPPGSWYKHGASAACIFEMSDRAVFSYRGSWCSEGMNTTWECDWRAIGEKGSALWDGAEKVSGEVVVGTEGFSREKKPLQVGDAQELRFKGHGGLIRDFLDAMDNGIPPQTTCEDNIKSLAMVHSAVRSAETGTKVPIEY